MGDMEGSDGPSSSTHPEGGGWDGRDGWGMGGDHDMMTEGGGGERQREHEPPFNRLLRNSSKVKYFSLS